jgi:hypothetical protein
MDTSERNAAYRFNTKVRCDCGCKKKVLIRTRDRHRKKLASTQPGSDGDDSRANSDVEMLEDPVLSASVPQVPPDLQDSEVADANNDPLPPELAPTQNNHPRAMGLDNAPNHDGQTSEILQNLTGHDSDMAEELYEAPSSPGSWYNVGTPPPSPARSPLVRSDEELSENEDGYFNITEDDYREYDRWYAEDCEAELDELRQCKLLCYYFI